MNINNKIVEYLSFLMLLLKFTSYISSINNDFELKIFKF